MLKNQTWLPTLLLGLALLLGNTTLQASGFHYNIDVSSRLTTNEQNQLSALHMDWLYDVQLSQILLENEDISPAGLPATLQDIANRMVHDLQTYHYFTQIVVNKQILPLAQVTDYQLQLLGERLQLTLSVPLQQPQPLAGQYITINMLDPAGTGTLKHAAAERIQRSGYTLDNCGVSITENADYDHGEPAQHVLLQCR